MFLNFGGFIFFISKVILFLVWVLVFGFKNDCIIVGIGLWCVMNYIWDMSI